MRTNARPWRIVLLAAIAAGCSAQPASYRSAAEIPEGPGMLSGREGSFALYSNRDAGTGAAAGGDAEFREFRELREFQRWKAANRDTPEYREFLDWREWREWQAYQAWRKRQE